MKVHHISPDTNEDRVMTTQDKKALQLESGSVYKHTRPTFPKQNVEWTGSSWPEAKAREAAPNSLANTWFTSPTTTLPPPDHVGAYQNNRPVVPKENAERKAWIVGGGIAGFKGENIVILEDENFVGGAFDAFGDAKEGYRARGGRELTWNHQNLWDMFSTIPSPELPGYSLLDEFRFTNDYAQSYSKARLLHQKGKILDFSTFNLNPEQRKRFTELEMMPIEKAYSLSIGDFFDETFFQTNFWLFWKTQFGFGEEKHQSLLQLKLYMHRFPEGLPGMNNLSCMKSSKYNQNDNWVSPIWKHLSEQGGSIQCQTLVEEIVFKKDKCAEGETLTATSLKLKRNGKSEEISLSEKDVVFATTGSHVAGTA
ncbi:hypothetical protein FAI40_01925 [Acetobacteraceae bacterium]|nr:hypothetical protein FAI40_01925 [Acetobacteraceae bacterium]